jgi:outer membrane receptor protein involved in Fe transport
MKTTKLTYLILILSLLLCALPAQTVTLNKFVVTASPTGELSFNPEVGKSAFGDNETILNTPRSVSSIDHSTLSQFNINSMGQMMNFVSGVQTVGSFGQFASVNVRGDLAESYVNDQRRSNNSFGFQPSFNGVESIDIVHGAPSVVFGPGFYSGGYVNLITKKAQKIPFTDVSITVGQLEPNGNSFLNTIYQIDRNIPITDSTSFRISYQGQKNETFYRRNGGKQNTQDLFTTLNHSTDSTTWDLIAEYSVQNTPEQIGINRVNQNLISNNLYRTGTINNPLDSSEIANGQLTNLPATSTLMSNGDFAKANVLFLQSIFLSRITPTFTFQNHTLVEYVDRQRYAAYEYLEYARQTTLDNRTELHFDTTKAYSIVGLDIRYEDRKVEEAYLNTFFNVFDITKGTTNSALNYPQSYYRGTVGMGGKEFFGPLDFVFDTTQSKLFSVSPFVQQRIHINDNLQFLYGVRIDKYRANAKDPLQNSAEGSVNTTSYGLTESIVYNFDDSISVYATVGRLEAINASVTGGGIVLDPDFKLSDKNFHSLNKLYEVGSRWVGEKSSVNLTAYWQYRQQHNFYVNQPDDIVVRGIELEYKSQLKPNLLLISNVNYMEANTDNSFPFEFSGNGLRAVSSSGDYRLPGLSRIYANSSLAYRFKSGVGVSLTGLYQSSQIGDGLGDYRIPSQYSFNSQLSYIFHKWNVSVNVYNLTNQRNWIHNGDFFGDNVVVGKELPINASLTASRRF